MLINQLCFLFIKCSYLGVGVGVGGAGGAMGGKVGQL